MLGDGVEAALVTALLTSLFSTSACSAVPTVMVSSSAIPVNKPAVLCQTGPAACITGARMKTAPAWSCRPIDTHHISVKKMQKNVVFLVKLLSSLVGQKIGSQLTSQLTVFNQLIDCLANPVLLARGPQTGCDKAVPCTPLAALPR